jgi:hypothetical protein
MSEVFSDAATTMLILGYTMMLINFPLRIASNKFGNTGVWFVIVGISEAVLTRWV